ncbi:hypothetical protein GCM10008179_19140 [Hansschlegelia plantiphila]|uniref:Uncharacterized protein n=1 Tax=Hansschlegelia plantiphila TaxID=374655 RepID=A0A9W6MVT8_9HYPH|nr:hypothetical protein GCM10008179_19140 [Hansschlegelia plantiphila]
MLAAETKSDQRRKTTYDKAVRVDDDPLLLDVGRFGHEGSGRLGSHGRSLDLENENAQGKPCATRGVIAEDRTEINGASAAKTF